MTTNATRADFANVRTEIVELKSGITRVETKANVLIALVLALFVAVLVDKVA